MTLVFIFWGEYAGFKDVLAAAVARAGCPIVVISDSSNPNVRGVEHIPVSEYKLDHFYEAFKKHTVPWRARSLLRWFVLREFSRRDAVFPLFCADWDVIILRNLQSSYAPFADCDFTVSRFETSSSAAYGINRMEPLDGFCEMLSEWIVNSPEKLIEMNDMVAWSALSQINPWNIGDLFTITNGSVFDHNMHCGRDRFQFDGEAKKIVYADYHPNFLSLDGNLVPANTVHCWGSYKTRTREVIGHCGIAPLP